MIMEGEGGGIRRTREENWERAEEGRRPWRGGEKGDTDEAGEEDGPSFRGFVACW